MTAQIPQVFLEDGKERFFSLFVLLGLDVVPVPRVCLFTSFAQSVNISWCKIFIILYVKINN